MFLDMDVAVSGSVVPAIETDFDRYWASESVWPLEAIIAADTVAEPIAATPRDDAATRAYLAQLKESDFATRLKNGSLEQSWSGRRACSATTRRKGWARHATKILSLPTSPRTLQPPETTSTSSRLISSQPIKVVMRSLRQPVRAEKSGY